MAGARLWNSLPHDIVASETLSHFRRGLKTFLFRRIADQYKVFSTENVNFKSNNVHEQIQKLYKLPRKGNDLKQAMEVEEKARDKTVDKRPSRIWYLPECAWPIFAKYKSSFW